MARHHAPAAALEGIDAIVHLAGDSVADGRWTDAKRQQIRDSRIVGTRHLVDAIAAGKTGPGDRPVEPVAMTRITVTSRMYSYLFEIIMAMASFYTIIFVQ